MSALPERYQRYALPGQRPTYPAAVELSAERAVVYVPSAEQPGVMVPVFKEYVQPMPVPQPRDLTPQPVLDPLAQRMLGGGIGAGAAGAGIGFGLNQLAAGVAVMGTSGAMILVALLLAASGMRGRGSVHIHQEVHNTARWFGKNTTNL